jgi:uncharacterized protein with GYD domain
MDPSSARRAPVHLSVWLGLVLLAGVIVTSGIAIRDALPSLKPFRADHIDQGFSIEPSSHDFGTVKQGEELTHIFKLSNRSNKTVRVVRVTASCSCTVPPLSLQGRILHVGESCDVPVVLQIGGKEGEVAAVADLFLENAVGPTGTAKSQVRVRMTLSATVLPDFHFEPRSVDFGVIDGQNTVTRSVTLYGDGLPDFAVSSVRVSDPIFVAGPPKVERRNPAIITIPISAKLPASFREGTRHGYLNDYLQIQTTSRRVPVARVSLKGLIKAPIVANPPAVVFLVKPDRASRSVRMEKTVVLEAASDFVVRDIRAGERRVRAVARSAGARASHIITISTAGESDVASQPSADVQQAHVEIVCMPVSSGRTESVTIPVYLVPVSNRNGKELGK